MQSSILVRFLSRVFARILATKGCWQGCCTNIVLSQAQQGHEGNHVTAGIRSRRVWQPVCPGALDDAAHAPGLQSPVAPQAHGHQVPCQAICCPAGSSPEAGPCGTVLPCQACNKLPSSKSFIRVICIDLHQPNLAPYRSSFDLGSSSTARGWLTTLQLLQLLVLRTDPKRPHRIEKMAQQSASTAYSLWQVSVHNFPNRP